MLAVAEREELLPGLGHSEQHDGHDYANGDDRDPDLEGEELGRREVGGRGRRRALVVDGEGNDELGGLNACAEVFDGLAVLGGSSGDRGDAGGSSEAGVGGDRQGVRGGVGRRKGDGGNVANGEACVVELSTTDDGKWSGCRGVDGEEGARAEGEVALGGSEKGKGREKRVPATVSAAPEAMLSEEEDPI